MRRGARSGVVVIGMLVALGACSSDGQDADPTPESPAAGTAGGSPSPTGSLPLDSTQAATLRIVSGYSSIRVTTGDLGDDLLRSDGASAEAAPVLTADDDVVTVAQPEGEQPATSLTLRLSDEVTWRVQLAGGASSVRLDLADGPVAGVQLAQGVSALRLSLPAPSGTLPVRLDAGASSVRIRVADGAPVRAQMDGGAGAVTLYGETSKGIAGGTTLTSPGWAQAADRVDVQCAAGLSRLVVARR